AEHRRLQQAGGEREGRRARPAGEEARGPQAEEPCLAPGGGGGRGGARGGGRGRGAAVLHRAGGWGILERAWKERPRGPGGRRRTRSPPRSRPRRRSRRSSRS